MTAIEILNRHLTSLLEANPDINNDIDKVQLLPEYGMMLNTMREYGKYCAEEAWKAKGSMTVYHGDFEDWWPEFQRKEATE